VTDLAALASERHAEWWQALRHDALPDFVERRLSDAGAGRLPWMSTMTPAELLLSREIGIRPITMVSGTCAYRSDRSWTDGHLVGWQTALARIKLEALAAGANAVVDVKLRTLKMPAGDRMAFTVIGSAIRLEGLPPSVDPVIATVSAIEFVRLLKEGIVPTGIAIGAKSGWINHQVNRNQRQPKVWEYKPLTRFGSYWQQTRKRAVSALREDAERMGDGVLAHTYFEQLLEAEREKPPANYLGLFIVIGTAVQCKRMDDVSARIGMLIDMCDGRSPLTDRAPRRQNAYPIDNDEEGAI
jgi:uncharacterized protein YbjQ (UPF0145 family)